mgnify:FL=1
MKKTNLFANVTLDNILLFLFTTILLINSYQIDKVYKIYKRGEQARISVEAAREVNKQDTVKIMKKQQCQGWNR